MRKILFRVIVLLLSVVTSCYKDMPEDSGQSDESVSLVAYVETATKTQLGELKGEVYEVLWSEGDMISVNGVPSSPLVASQAYSASASFTLYGVVSPYNAVYPASIVKGMSEGQVSVELPGVQEYVEGGFADGAAVLYGYSENENVSFKNACGVIKVGLTTGRNASKVCGLELESKGAPISGSFSLDIHDGTFMEREESSLKISLLLPENGILLSEAPVYFHIAVPAGGYTEGFDLTVTDELGRDMTAHITVPEGVVKSGFITKVESALMPKALEIKDVESWNEFAQAVMAGDYRKWVNKDGEVCVSESFTVPANKSYTRISRGDTDGFDGVLNGNGHTITFESPADPLFIQTAPGSVIKNLTLAGERTKFHDWGTCNFVVYHLGTMENCESKVNVTIADRNAEVMLSGLVRSNAGEMRDCINSGNFSVGMKLSSEKRLTAGGISCSSTYSWNNATNAGTYIDCINKGNIDVSAVFSQTTFVKYVDLGGITARVDGGTEEDYVTVSGCVNSGTISMTESESMSSKSSAGNSYSVGGIVGSVGQYNATANAGFFLSAKSGGFPCEIKGCTNSGTIELCAVNKAENKKDPNSRAHIAAGIVAYMYGTTSAGSAILDGCINTGRINCGYCNKTFPDPDITDKFTLSAGVLGMGMSVKMTDCSSTAIFGKPETALYSGYFGALAGYAVRNCEINNCQATMTIDEGVLPISQEYVAAGVLAEYTLTLSGTNMFNSHAVTKEDIGTLGTGTVTITQ